MSSKPMNLLFIMSDEHNRQMSGCYGHPHVRTPNIDKLARNGVRFTNAYCNSPICVPARSALATGRYVHETGNWDNAAPYHGEVPSWGHRLIEQGHEVVSIGKLHYRNDSDDNGFSRSVIPLHVVDGVGDVFALVRDNFEPKLSNRKKIEDAGPGESSYTRYDRSICDEAVEFLRQQSDTPDKPWVLFVSFVCPHFPLIAPQRFYDMYPHDQVVLPKQHCKHERPTHPAIEMYRHISGTRDDFDEASIRKALATYYALCSYMDDQVGQVLGALEQSGLADNTRIIYTSDHGDTMGEHGVWFKNTMYEGSVTVPMIVAGPDLPKGKVVDTPVSLVDCFPTIVDAVGGQLDVVDTDLPGRSLLDFAHADEVQERWVFSEYHASGSITGTFMIRTNQYKLVHYVGFDPQLFDLIADPGELRDLAGDAQYSQVLASCMKKLREVCSPGAVDRQAKNSQNSRVAAHGGREAVINGGYTIPFSPVPEQFQ
ncbi:sulfatase-like hydrolase/transferase [Pseudomonas putida]|uniref:sulfatase-like hydrolase/transferase n=1 Tax=Pseudomonas putida TaxID=303 RepID=UPI0033503896